MLTRFWLSVVVGAMVFAGFWVVLSGPYPYTLIASLLTGGMVGCLSSVIGGLGFRLVKRLGLDTAFSRFVHFLLRVAIAVVGFFGGAVLSFFFYVFFWNWFVYRLHPSHHYPGDIEGIFIILVGAPLATVLSLLNASVIVRAWTDRVEMRHED